MPPDAEGLKALDHLGTNGAVNPHAAERDAPVAAVVKLAAPTVIAARAAVLAAVGDVQLAAAVPAPQQASQQCLAPSDRAAAHKAFAVGIIGDQPLVPFELRPTNVALVVVDKTSQVLRSLRKPRTIRLRPASIVTRLPVRPKA